MKSANKAALALYTLFPSFCANLSDSPTSVPWDLAFNRLKLNGIGSIKPLPRRTTIFFEVGLVGHDITGAGAVTNVNTSV